MSAAIGQLRERVTIQRPTETRDAAGQVTAAWVDVATVFAAVEPLNAGEVYRARQVGSSVTHRVTVRHRPDLADAGGKWRLLHRGRAMAIEGAIDPDFGGVWLVLSCYSE